MIKPPSTGEHAVVIEFKHKGKDGEDLTEAARKALAQVDEKDYMHALRREGYGRICKYGIAFHKKNCAVAMDAA